MVQPRLTGRLRSHWLRLDGCEMHYLRSDGPEPPNDVPVVFLHGILAGSSFERVGELTAPYYRCYVPDLPGIGGSEKRPNPPTMDELCGLIRRWMDHCGINSVHLAGQSFGCSLGVELAIAEPERVVSLTLQGLTGEPGRRHPVSLFRHWLLAELRETPKGKLKKNGQKQVSREALQNLVAVMVDYPLEQKLSQVLCPTLVLHGAHDFLVSTEWAERATLTLPFGRLTHVPGATHTMHARQPDAYADALLTFLEQLPEPMQGPGTPTKGDSHVAKRTSVFG